jgi:hypothetical protein
MRISEGQNPIALFVGVGHAQASRVFDQHKRISCFDSEADQYASCENR